MFLPSRLLIPGYKFAVDGIVAVVDITTNAPDSDRVTGFHPVVAVTGALPAGPVVSFGVYSDHMKSFPQFY